MRVYKLICCVAIASCAAAPNVEDNVFTRDSAGVRITVNTSSTPATTWQLTTSPTVELGADEPGGVLHQVRGAVRLNNGQYVVANGGYDELRWYDASGRFVRQTGREGDGPGEFQSLSWLGRHQGDTVIAWDTRNRHVSLFNGDGGFVTSIPAQRRGAVYGIFADGSLLFGQVQRGSEGFVRHPVTLWRVVPWRGTVDSIGSYPGDEQMVTRRPRNGGFRIATQSPPFGRDGVFAARGNGVLVSDQQDYEIREYTTNDRLVSIVRLRRPTALVTTEDIETYQRVALEGYWRSDFADRRRRLAEQRYPAAFPAHGRILVDQSANIWVQDYPKPWASTVNWLVFDRNHRLFSTVSIPANLEIFEVGTDYVLGMWTDDYGVQHVGVFGLMKP